MAVATHVTDEYSVIMTLATHVTDEHSVIVNNSITKALIEIGYMPCVYTGFIPRTRL